MKQTLIIAAAVMCAGAGGNALATLAYPSISAASKTQAAYQVLMPSVVVAKFAVALKDDLTSGERS